METQIELVIEQCNDFAAGQSFDAVGAYERLVGSLELAVDPSRRSTTM